MTGYPVRVQARLDEPLSRWLWLVKWLLAIPHYVVLAFLWIAYSVLTVVAFFAILITGRYPRAIFDFNVGVLRWTWRVTYYSYGALGTDRYPPFTLAEVPDYPATLSVEYPQHLSRGLALVKWWLLAIPHYVIVAVFLGGWYAYTTDGGERVSPPGLIGLLTFLAGLSLLIFARYPRGVFDFVLGMNRWALRVAAYASLMTDEYPPFRLDGGGEEPADRPPPPLTGPPGEAATPAPAEPRVANTSNWSAGRVVTAIVGATLLLVGLGVTAGGATISWADATQRDSAGYLSAPTERYSTSGYALRFDALETGAWPVDADLADWLGTVRISVDAGPTRPVFVGIADRGDVTAYLGDGTAGYRGDGWIGNGPRRGMEVLASPPTTPAAQDFWVASTSGAGPQSLTWEPTAGRWTLVVMNADASRAVDARVAAGATVPVLPWVGVGLLIGGGVALLGGALLVMTAVWRSRRIATPVA